MNTQSNQDLIDDLFDQAIKLPAEDRKAFLMDACNGENSLLADVQVLVDAHERLKQAPGFLPEPSPHVNPFADNANLARERSIAHDDIGDASATVAWPATPGICRYRTLSFHAEGGLGKVSVAMDTELNRKVAFKEIRDRFADDSASRARFLVEAEVTGRLEHPGVVPVYGLGRFDNGRPYYAMRFIHGETLKKASDKLHATDQDRETKRIALRRLIERFLNVCDAVAYAHARAILHRDLKPDNVMLGKYGETLVVDWGLTKSLEHGHREPDSDEETLRPDIGSDSDPTIQGRAIGAPRYMSPEQASGNAAAIGPATDVFGLGATLYHLICGMPPIEGEGLDAVLENAKSGNIRPPNERLAEVPLALDAICMRAMAFDPSNRFATVLELRAAVQEWLDNEPISGLLATVRHFEALHKEFPDRAEYQERLGRELAVLSKVLQSLARYDESRLYAELAVHLLNTLFQRDPNDLWRFEELSIARGQLASIFRAMAREGIARELEDANKQDLRQLIKRARGQRGAHGQLMSVTLHHGFSLVEAEKLLQDHLSGADTVDFGIDDAVGYMAPPFQRLLRTLVGEKRYELLELLGSGGAAEVYLARDRLLPRTVALKQAHAKKFSGHVFFEACVLSALSHPNIPPVYDLGLRKDGIPFFTTNIIEGCCWEALATDRPDSKRELNSYWRKILPGFVQVCNAIHHAHRQGVIHCDLKPSNILVDEDGRPWIVDWGISLIADPNAWPQLGNFASIDGSVRQYFFPQQVEGQVRGTPAYMSPEQARGAKIDGRSDVFTLGASLFMLLTGQCPFPVEGTNVPDMIRQRMALLHAPSPRALDHRIPKRLAALCVKAMAPNPMHRQPSALELGDEVRQWLGE